MQYINEEVLLARAIPAVIPKRVPTKWLILSPGKSAFFSAADYASKLQEFISKRESRAVKVESSDIVPNSLISVRNLIRLIQKFDSIQLFYSGAVSFNKGILPAAIISRFFGKSVALLYYPDQIVDKIPFIHRKTMSLCGNVYLGTRYLQRTLARFKVKSEVMLAPADVKALPMHIIREVQPHILLKQNDTTNAGTICIMKAVAMVKQKYPRTELSVMIENFEEWLDSDIDAEQFVQPFDCTISFVPEKFPENFKKADVYINCSPSETVPLALLAAMASGIPSISFDTYGAREIIENGINGLLIRHFDHNQLADQIIKLVEEPELVENISKEAVKIRQRLGAENFARLAQ